MPGANQSTGPPPGARARRQCNIQIKQIYQIKANPVIRIRIRPKVLLFDSYLYRVGHIRICIREFLFVCARKIAAFVFVFDLLYSNIVFSF